MDVTLPNGVVIKGVPENATRDQIKQKAIAAGLATEADFSSSTPTQQEIDVPQNVQQPQSTGQPSFLDRLAQTSSDISGQINRSLQGVGESALTMGSAAIAEPVAGWAGILSMLPGGRTPAEAVEQTREALTYQPRTQAG